MLDYFPNADHAGIYAAQGTGAFDRAGIDLDIQAPSDPATPLKLLAAGRVDLAISYEPELLLARDQGQKLVAVGALVQTPLTSVVSIGKRAISSPEELKGKTVGTAGIPYQSAYLKAILEQAGVEPSSVREVNVGFNLVPAMLSGRVDATLGAFWNYEAIQLRLQDKRPEVIRMESAGVPTYNELIVVARESDVRENGARIRRFMRALGQGTQALRKDPSSRRRPAAARQPRPRAAPADGEREGHAARLLPVRHEQAGRLDERRRVECATRPGCRATGCCATGPTRRARSTNEFLPGEGV